MARTIQEEYERYCHNRKANSCAECEKKCPLGTEPVKPKKTETKPKQKENVCPECGEGMNAEGGCVICKNCGYSKCD